MCPFMADTHAAMWQLTLLHEENFSCYDNWYISSSCEILVIYVYTTPVIMEILVTPVADLHCTVSITSSTPGPGCSLSAVTGDKDLVSEICFVFTLKYF